MAKQIRWEVPPGSAHQVPVEYDDGTDETPDTSGSDAETHESEIHDESAGGGEGTETEPAPGDGAEPDETT